MAGSRSTSTLSMTGVLLCLLVACGGASLETNFSALQNFAPLDPGRYEARIRGVDREIFVPGLLDDSRREVLAARLVELAEEIERHEGNTPAIHFAGELRTLARLTERQRDDLPVDDGPLQDQWRRIRGSLFDDASWFAHSAADLNARDGAPRGEVGAGR